MGDLIPLGNLRLPARALRPDRLFYRCARVVLDRTRLEPNMAAESCMLKVGLAAAVPGGTK